MSYTATITAKTGPAITDTSIIISGITKITYDFDRQIVFITTNGLIKEYDLNGVTTITTSVSGSTVTIS